MSGDDERKPEVDDERFIVSLQLQLSKCKNVLVVHTIIIIISSSSSM